VSASAWQSSTASPKHTTEPSPSPPGPLAGSAPRCTSPRRRSKMADDDQGNCRMTHGWPGSVMEMIDSVGPLTDPTADGGQPAGNLTRDNVLDNITTYWLTGTGASAARSYWEAYGPDAPAAAASLCPRPRYRSASRRSPARSGGPRAAGLRRATRMSSISTRSTRAATSPPGRSRNSSPMSYAPRSRRFAECTSPTTHGGPHDYDQHAP
jgi:hypothetical protein